MNFPTSLADQMQILSNLSTLSIETQSLVSFCERNFAVLEALKKSLLHQTFTDGL